MNKRGGAGLVIFLAVLIFVIIAVIVGFVLFGDTISFSGKNNEKNTGEIKIPLIFQTRQGSSLSQISANYKIFALKEEGRSLVKEGVATSSGWTEVEVPLGYRMEMQCYSDTSYLVRGYKDHTVAEIDANQSIFTCDMDKICNPTITHEGSINSQVSSVKLNVSCSSGAFYKTSMCFAWTSGFLDVSLKDQFLRCDQGVWKNYTSFDAQKQEYEWLPEGQYVCGADGIPIDCEYTQGTSCKVASQSVPERLKNKVDSCVSTGKTIREGSEVFELEVKGLDYQNSLDNIKIYLYDKDRRYNSVEEDLAWYSEYEGVDIGAKDKEYVINYHQ